MRTITIEVANGFTVREGDRCCTHLTWDEMLAQVVELTHQRLGQGRYPMLTAEERAREERAWKARAAKSEQEEGA